MRVKKYLIATLAVLLVLSLGLVACKDNTEPEPEPEPAPAPTITLSQTSAVLDLYESLTLTAETENTQSAVTWSTSNAAVATVDGGVVTAVAVGSATITASVDDVSATCNVTVTNSYTAPVLRVNETYVPVALNGSFTVTAETTWKGSPLDGVTYTWALAEGADGSYASVTPSSDGSSAVITGLAYGETAFTVSADVRGVTLVQTVSVRVCNTDITFEVSNLAPTTGGFAADVSLVETDTDPATVTPSVTVYDNGTEVPDATIVWTSSDDDIATITDGVIDAVSEGTATLTGTFDNNFVRIYVNAYRPEIALSVETLEIETAAPQYTLTDMLVGTVTGARLNGTDVFGSYDAEENVITFDTAKLPSEVSAMGDGKQFVIDTDMAQYTADAAVYTKVLRTPEDINNWNQLSYDADSSAIHWGGYFVLGNDIDMGDTAFDPLFVYSYFYDTTTWQIKPEFDGFSWLNGRDTGGFRGIFDGRGYNIDNFTINDWNGSFAGQMCATGVVRNVSFTNVTLGAATCLISVGGVGRIENVYAQINSVTAGSASNTDKTGVFFGQDSMGDARIYNCFVDFTTTLTIGNGFTGLGSYHLGWGQLNGMYAVGMPTGSGFNLLSTGTGSGDMYGAYATYAELLTADIDFSSWAGDFWQIVNGVPYPAGLDLPEGTMPSVSADEYAPIGGSLTLTGLGKYDVVTVSDEAAALGVTFAGGRIQVPDDIEIGTEISFTVYSLFDSSLAQTRTVRAVQSNTVTVDTVYDVEVEGGETFTVDLSDYANDIVGTLYAVEMNGESFTGSMSYSNGILTLDMANLVGTWGEQTLSVTFCVENGGVAESFTFADISLDIVTMIINDEAELNRFLEVAAENATGNSWAGYFVLGNDIVCTGTYASHYVSGDTRGDMGVAVGFNGIFDGQGYTIYNLHTVGDQGGFVGPLGQHGILRNVSFVNAINTGNGGFITSGGAGTVENVFVHISVTPNTSIWGNAASVLASDPYGVMRFNNVIVEYSEPLPDGATTGAPFWSMHQGFGILNGVYAVGTDILWNNLSTAAPDSGDVYGVYDSWTDFAAAGYSFSSWTEGGFWTLVNGIPVPARLADSEDAPVINNTELSVPAGSTVAIDCDDPYLILSLDSAAEEAGITIAGKTVTIPGSAADTTFTVTAESFATGLTDTVTFTAIEAVAVDVSETTEIDMTASGDLTFDLTDYVDEIEGELTNAAIGGTAFTTLQYAGNTLTLDRATLGSLYGAQTIAATFEASDGDTVTKITTVNIPVLLVTKYISTNEDLQNLADFVIDTGSGYGGYFVQTADLDAGGNRIGLGTWSNDLNAWTMPFGGTYDGGGHVISNMAQGTNQGMFSQLSGTLKNVVFYNAQLTGEGGIVATELRNGTVENVAVYGSMTGGSGASWAPNSLLVSKALESAVVRNCLVVLMNHNLTATGTNAGMLVGDTSSATVTIENSIAVNLKNAATVNEYAMPAIGNNAGGGRLATGTDRATVHTFHGWAEYIAWAAEADLAAYTGGTAWAMNGSDIPVASAESLSDELAAVDVSGIAATVPAGEATTLILNGIGYYADFAVSDSEGVALSGGVVTVDDTFTGSFTLTVTALLNDELTEPIEIFSAVTTNLSETTEIELNYASDAGVSNTVDLSAALAGGGTYTVDSLTVAGKNVNATLSGTTLTLTDATTDIGNTVWGEQTMVLIVSDADGALTVVNIPVLVITQVIRTPEQLADWNALAYAADSAGNYWAGYFVLGNDIDMTDTTFNAAFSYADMYYGEVEEDPDLSWTIKPEYAGLEWKNGRTGGFRGVFDGRGHVIDNLNMAKWNGSFAGQIATAGVVRNIVFTNVTLDGAASLVSVGGTGRIENVYAHIVSVTAGSSGDPTGVFLGAGCMAEARIVNCFALFDPTPSTAVGGDTGFTGLGSYHKGYGILNNMYAVGLATGDGFITVSTGEESEDGGYGAYATAEEFAAAVTVDADNGWDMTFWTTDSDGLPIPVALAEAQA